MADPVFRQCVLSCGHVRLTTWLDDKGIDIGTCLVLDGDDRVWAVEDISEMTKSRDEMISMRTSARVFGPSLPEKSRVT